MRLLGLALCIVVLSPLLISLYAAMLCGNFVLEQLLKRTKKVSL